MTAFLTVILMPLTYSIAYGLIAGIGCYIIMMGTFRLLELVGIQAPVFDPPEGGSKDYVEESVSPDEDISDEPKPETSSDDEPGAAEVEAEAKVEAEA